jgi:radical SAM superfamily enzyme YgiQ (UPF0313 family)
LKILLISPNREALPDPVFPIGLAYLATATIEAGHEVHMVDLCFVEDIEDTLKAACLNFSPELIGISIRNIDDVSYPKSISYLSLYRNVIEICRRHSDAPIVAGGSGFTIMPEDFMKELDIDYGIVGEGEVSFIDLIRYLQKEGDLPDAVVKDKKTDGIPCINMKWKNLRPARSLFSIKDYYEKGGMLNMQTRRGCPFRCIYCSYPLIEGKTSRFREVQEVVDEIQEVVEQTGVKHFFIVDSIFNHPKEYALKFSKALIERGLDIKWNCYANPGLMEPELIEMMLLAGCTGVEFGTDSLLDNILENLKKDFKYKQVKDVSRACRESGLRFCHFIFMGPPGETPDDIKMNIERLSSLNADSSIIMVGIRIFPRTELSVRAEYELGINNVGLSPVYYISPHVVNEIENFVEIISQEHKNWVLPGFEINYSERLQKLLRKAGLKGSLWEELSNR